MYKVPGWRWGLMATTSWCGLGIDVRSDILVHKLDLKILGFVNLRFGGFKVLALERPWWYHFVQIIFQSQQVDDTGNGIQNGTEPRTSAAWSLSLVIDNGPKNHWYAFPTHTS